MNAVFYGIYSQSVESVCRLFFLTCPACICAYLLPPVCHFCASGMCLFCTHNGLKSCEVLLKSHLAALRDEAFEAPTFFLKFGCGNLIMSNERQAYMGSVQSSPEGQA